MKKIMLSLAVIAIVAVGAVGATRAYFTSTSTSTGNTFTAGTMELSLGSDAQGYATSGITFGTANNMAPGETSGPYNLYFKNTGNINGNLKVNMTYTGKGDGTSDWDKVAKKMVISSASFEVNDGVQYYWAQQILNKYPSALAWGMVINNDSNILIPTVYGLSSITLYTTDNDPSNEMIWAPGVAHKETIFLMFDKSATNELQGNSINIIVNAVMKQATDTTLTPFTW